MTSFSHREARQALLAALDGHLQAEAQSDLDRHLVECLACREYAARLAETEARLSSSLQKRWQEKPPSERELASTLGKIQTQARRGLMFKKFMRSAAWAVAAIAFFVVLSWGIRTFAPRPTPMAQATLTEIQPTMLGPTKVADTPVPTTMPSPAPTPPVVPYPKPSPLPPGAVSLFPNIEFTFNTQLPTEPAQVTVYSQQLSQAITVESARQVAASLGVQGAAFEEPSEGFGMSIINISNGVSQVRFFNYPDQFNYTPDNNISLDDNGDLPPFDQQVAIATAFLQERGLLNQPYRTEPLPYSRGGVRFGQLLDNIPVIFGIGSSSDFEWIDVTVNAAGQVTQVSYSQHNYQPVGQYSILSAQEAWQRLSSPQASQLSMYAVLSPQEPVTYQSWVRAYPTGQPVDLYGYASIMQPAEAGGSPQVWFDQFTLEGNIQNLIIQNTLGRFLHVWGQIFQDTIGRRVFNVTGWEITNLVDENLSGVIRRQGNQGVLVADDGRTLIVPDLPANLPDQARIDIRGVIQAGTQPTLDWSFIASGTYPNSYSSSMSCGGGGGGGGGGPENADFGGGGFSLVNIGQASLPPSPTPSVSPLQEGDPVEDLVGTVNVNIQKFADNRTTTEVGLMVEPGVLSPEGWYFRLEGVGLGGIEQFQNLPIKIWGQVIRLQDGYPVINVDRFVEAYPGLRVQAWIGTQSVVTLEGKDLILFTTQSGAQYVLKNSIGCGAGCLVGPGGGSIIIEGVAIPGKTFGGYPVISELSTSMTNGLTDLSGYLITSNQPYVIDHTQETGGGFNTDQYLVGKVTIDQVELAYTAISLLHCSSTAADDPMLRPWLYVQPVWIFKGYFEDGRLFEIQVQALPVEYLTVNMP